MNRILKYEKKIKELQNDADDIAKKMAEPNQKQDDFMKLHNKRTNIIYDIHSYKRKISFIHQGKGYLGEKLESKIL